MAGVEGHQFTRRPKTLRGRIKGQVYGCTCGWVTFGRLADAILAHAGHVRTLPDERQAELDRVRAELAEVEAQLAALTGAR